MTFSEKMTDLKKTVQRLEVETLSLEESLELFEKGMAMAQECSDYLQGVERKITILTDGEEKNFENREEE